MGREHTFFDEEFRGANYDPNDDGTFTRNLVFVAMAFTGDEIDGDRDVSRRGQGRK